MDILAESAVRVTVLALGVAVVLRALQIRSPRLAHRAWTAVTVTMLLMPAAVAWGPALALPLLPSSTTIASIAPEAGGEEPAAAEPRMPAPPAIDGAPSRIDFAGAAIAVYLAGVGLFLLRLGIAWRRAGAIRRRAVLALGRLTHPACVTPMTVGIMAPAVILPPDWASWDRAELAAVLAHEEEHVRRRDPLVVAVALLNRAIFWFHPLAWWLPREIARLAERACDAAVVSRGHDTDVYSACLLRFARRVREAGGRIVPMTMAMSGAGLHARLGMLGRPQAPRPSASQLGGAAGACAALVIVCAAGAPSAIASEDSLAQAGDQAAWAVHASEHFEIFHDGLPPGRVSEAARDAEAAYAQLSAALKHDLARPVPIILVRRDRDLPGTSVPAGALIPQGRAAGRQRLVVSLESLDRRTGVLVHELTHQFAFEIVPDTSRAAPFLIEGLAEHQRGTWNAEDLRRARDGAAAGAIPPVATLAASDRHWAHAVFDFVAAQYGEEGVRRLLFALRAHETLIDAVPMAFGVTVDRFDEELRGYVTTTFGQRLNE